MIFLCKKFSLLSVVILLSSASSIRSDANDKADDPLTEIVDSNGERSQRRILLRPLYMPDGDAAAQRADTRLKPELLLEQVINQEPCYESVKFEKHDCVPEWLVRSSFKNAPWLLRGIYNYLRAGTSSIVVPSFHRFMLVGQPGTGKTTLAYALANLLGYQTVFIPATALLGHYRNETAVNMRKCFESIIANGAKKIVIIDELHKLFEHYKEDKSDQSQTAAAFWLMLDTLEKHHPNILVVGTANDVSKLPPEIKSRFHGKMITVPMPTKKQKLLGFKNIIEHDRSLVIDKAVDDKFMNNLISSSKNCSLRDIQLIIDTAKMYRYAAGGMGNQSRITLDRRHFEQAVKKLEQESHENKESLLERIYPRLEKWSLVISVTANIMSISRMVGEWCGFSRR